MKKKRLVVLVLSVSVIIIVLLLVYPMNKKGIQITGNIIDQTTAELRFFDIKSKCIIDGEVYLNNRLIGRTINGAIILGQTSQESNNIISIKGLTDSCFKDPGLVFYESWSLGDLDYYLGKIVNFNAELTPRYPEYYEEMQGFVRPNETIGYLSNLNFVSNDEDNLDKIVKYRIRYRSDSLLFQNLEYWQTPKETLDLGHGDCEDWATTALSLIRAYNDSIKCYNIFIIFAVCFIPLSTI